MQLTINGTPIYYEVRGEGLPFIILHGFHLDHDVMMGAFEPLFTERDGFQRIYPDMPGMGFTPAHDDLATSEAMAEVMIAFIDELLTNQPFIIGGFSYGGYIARAILKARQSLVQGLFLMAPSVNSDYDVRDLPEQMVITSDPDAIALLPEHLQPLILSTLSVQTRPVIQRIIDEYCDSFPRADQAFLQKLRATKTYSYHPEVDKLDPPFDKPSLILTGRHDNHTGYADAFQLARNYPRATYVTLDRAGHGVYLEQDTLFRALTNEWLDRVEESVNTTVAQPVGLNQT